ncbi:MAG: Uma2 family endonuclease, partial [Saprospiraceae bacterium]|nr:Uma2 family endonuclease [Saprospiraceae bacterium]
MGAEIRLPLTRMEIAEMAGTGVARFPATFEEYWEIVKEAEYTADFYQDQIIIPMSYESNSHSKLAVEISFLLRGLFRSNSHYEVHNSNRPLYFPDCKENGAVFNPDASVIR